MPERAVGLAKHRSCCSSCLGYWSCGWCTRLRAAAAGDRTGASEASEASGRRRADSPSNLQFRTSHTRHTVPYSCTLEYSTCGTIIYTSTIIACTTTVPRYVVLWISEYYGSSTVVASTNAHPVRYYGIVLLRTSTIIVPYHSIVYCTRCSLRLQLQSGLQVPPVIPYRTRCGSMCQEMTMTMTMTMTIYLSLTTNMINIILN